jgi:hypothetical protein
MQIKILAILPFLIFHSPGSQPGAFFYGTQFVFAAGMLLDLFI